MIAAAIFVGIIAFVLVGSIVFSVVPNNYGACMLPATVGFMWGSWPLFYKAYERANNLLHPPIMMYPVNMQVAFSKMRQLLSELSYNFGDKWNTVVADTSTGRIVADLRFADDQFLTESDSRGMPHTRKTKVQRYIRLEMELKPEGSIATLLKMDFDTRIEGFDKSACDVILQGVIQGINDALGEGKMLEKSVPEKIPAPPWWLIGVTAMALFVLFIDVHKAVWGS